MVAILNQIGTDVACIGVSMRSKKKKKTISCKEGTWDRMATDQW